MNENIPDIVRDVDCIQETKQYSCKIEYNWLINNIFNQIESKRPGEKIESETFCYESERIKSNDYETNNNNKQETNKSSQLSTNTDINISYSYLTLNTEILCNFFLANALWRIELNRSSLLNNSDTNSYMSFSTILAHANNVSTKSFTNYNFDSLLSKTNLTLKLKINLLNAEMNDLFERKTIEMKIDLKSFFQSLHSTTASVSQQQQLNHQNSTQLVEKFTTDKLCKIKQLLIWLNERKSRDFCIITEFKVYVTHNLVDCSVSKSTETVLILNYKHAWIIKNWYNFLMKSSQQHTFMNDAEISNMLASSSDEENLIKLVKFRSKLFSFLNNNNNKHLVENSTNNIDKLLKNVKWKLQLYPNGYNKEYEKNLSLFVNFSQLTEDLAEFSSTNTKSKHNNNSKKIEETFYDSNDSKGLILLIKSQSSSSLFKEDLNNEDNNIEYSEPRETFVKAAFEISILNSNGKRVDKCQSEKQLFELNGSWGYKEYMTIKDLNDFKEKYLSAGSNNLNLNCKIILFYTLTSKKMNLADLDNSLITSFSSFKEANNSSSSIISEENNIKSSLSYSSLLSSTASISIHDSLLKEKNLKKKDPINECNSLIYDLRRLFQQSDMFDIIIRSPINLVEPTKQEEQTEFKSFKAHKLILAIRSQVFETMFNSDKQQKSSNNIPQYVDIVDFDSNIVEIFLNYLYTDRIELKSYYNTNTNKQENENYEKDSNNIENEKNLFIELFKISDKYQVHKLKQLSESKLIKLISSDSCIELLIVAYLHNSVRLKKNCFKHLACNLNNIVTQPHWSLLEKNYPSLLAEAFRILYFKQKF